MNLLSNLENETRGSASNSSGFWGKLERAGVGEPFGDAIIAMVLERGSDMSRAIVVYKVQVR